MGPEQNLFQFLSQWFLLCNFLSYRIHSPLSISHVFEVQKIVREYHSYF